MGESVSVVDSEVVVEHEVAPQWMEVRPEGGALDAAGMDGGSEASSRKTPAAVTAPVATGGEGRSSDDPEAPLGLAMPATSRLPQPT